MKTREKFLMKVYDQMYNDLDRHYNFIWLLMALLTGAGIVLAILSNGILSIDIAVLLVTIISFWVLANIFDVNYWYNRNLAIIANIERQFLLDSDLKDIHFYFGEHRKYNAIQTTLKIQSWYTGIGLISFIVYHFYNRIIPLLFHGNIEDSKLWIRFIPYIVSIVLAILVVQLKHRREIAYQEFIKQSPGRKVESSN